VTTVVATAVFDNGGHDDGGDDGWCTRTSPVGSSDSDLPSDRQIMIAS